MPLGTIEAWPTAASIAVNLVDQTVTTAASCTSSTTEGVAWIHAGCGSPKANNHPEAGRWHKQEAPLEADLQDDPLNPGFGTLRRQQETKQ